MKTTEDILAEMSECAYLWKDNKTIDIEVDDKEKSFVKELIDFQCPKCENHVIKGNEGMFDSFTEDVKGVKITCRNCKQVWFIHKPVPL